MNSVKSPISDSLFLVVDELFSDLGFRYENRSQVEEVIEFYLVELYPRYGLSKLNEAAKSLTERQVKTLLGQEEFKGEAEYSYLFGFLKSLEKEYKLGLFRNNTVNKILDMKDKTDEFLLWCIDNSTSRECLKKVRAYSLFLQGEIKSLNVGMKKPGTMNTGRSKSSV